MELFNPDIGLAFWMLVSFGIVVFLLGKYVWPTIMNAIHAREQYIVESITAADEAQEKLKNIQKEGNELIAKAREEQIQILQDAKKIKDKTINEARDLAKQETEKVMEKARQTIQKEKENALREIRRQVAFLSLDIAEKILRKDLDNKNAQMDLANRILDEINMTKQ
ncbi:MAG: F0F1 ATP synthase subunit B [Prevotellaceae bacterium]|jgi:F-type H+-transporting ATPase subunit b|nr:F0F1 ATP synthase subunit B [Prevotellaceae bacterium]